MSLLARRPSTLLGIQNGARALSLRDDLGARALDDGEEFLLFLVGDLKPVKRGLQVAENGVELRIGDPHSGMGGFDFFAVVVSRAAGGQDEELNQMFLEVRYVLIGGAPGDRFAVFAEEREAALNSFALPVHSRVLQHARHEIVHNGGNAVLATEAVEEREFSHHLGGLVGSGGTLAVGIGFGGHCLLHTLLAGPGELLIPGHPLASPLIGLAAA